MTFAKRLIGTVGVLVGSILISNNIHLVIPQLRGMTALIVGAGMITIVIFFEMRKT